MVAGFTVAGSAGVAGSEAVAGSAVVDSAVVDSAVASLLTPIPIRVRTGAEVLTGAGIHKVLQPVSFSNGLLG